MGRDGSGRGGGIESGSQTSRNVTGLNAESQERVISAAGSVGVSFVRIAAVLKGWAKESNVEKKLERFRFW